MIPLAMMFKDRKCSLKHTFSDICYIRHCDMTRKIKGRIGEGFPDIRPEMIQKMSIAVDVSYAHFEMSTCVAACFCVSNSIISLHHFYTILVWGYMEIYEIMIWLVMGKTH